MIIQVQCKNPNRYLRLTNQINTIQAMTNVKVNHNSNIANKNSHGLDDNNYHDGHQENQANNKYFTGINNEDDPEADLVINKNIVNASNYNNRNISINNSQKPSMKRSKVANTSFQIHNSIRISMPLRTSDQRNSKRKKVQQTAQSIPSSSSIQVDKQKLATSFMFKPSLEPKRTCGNAKYLMQVLHKKVRARTIQSKFQYSNYTFDHSNYYRYAHHVNNMNSNSMNVHVNGYNNNCSKKGFRGSKLSPYSIFQNNIMNRNKYQLNPNGNNPNSFICNRITYEENTKSNRLLNKYILTDMGATDGHQVDVDILEIQASANGKDDGGNMVDNNGVIKIDDDSSLNIRPQKQNQGHEEHQQQDDVEEVEQFRKYEQWEKLSKFSNKLRFKELQKQKLMGESSYRQKYDQRQKQIQINEHKFLCSSYSNMNRNRQKDNQDGSLNKFQLNQFDTIQCKNMENQESFCQIQSKNLNSKETSWIACSANKNVSVQASHHKDRNSSYKDKYRYQNNNTNNDDIGAVSKKIRNIIVTNKNMNLNRSLNNNQALQLKKDETDGVEFNTFRDGNRVKEIDIQNYLSNKDHNTGEKHSIITSLNHAHIKSDCKNQKNNHLLNQNNQVNQGMNNKSNNQNQQCGVEDGKKVIQLNAHKSGNSKKNNKEKYNKQKNISIYSHMDKSVAPPKIVYQNLQKFNKSTDNDSKKNMSIQNDAKLTQNKQVNGQTVIEKEEEHKYEQQNRTKPQQNRPKLIQKQRILSRQLQMILNNKLLIDKINKNNNSSNTQMQNLSYNKNSSSIKESEKAKIAAQGQQQQQITGWTKEQRQQKKINIQVIHVDKTRSSYLFNDSKIINKRTKKQK